MVEEIDSKKGGWLAGWLGDYRGKYVSTTQPPFFFYFLFLLLFFFVVFLSIAHVWSIPNDGDDRPCMVDT